MKLNEMTIADARRRLDEGEISAVDLTAACLKRIQAVNRKLNACLLIDERGALAAARAADKRLAAGERNALLGIPFLAKDNIMTKGLVTTAGSRMLEKYVAPYDATVMVRLKEAGAVLLGKTNLDEFAHGSSTEYSAFGPTKNPWDRTRVPGGSSGGSAAAVAADMCLFALGTDTGGSVRHPAAFCGVTGFKPTYGLCSRFGLIAMTSSTDVPGVLSKTPADAALVLDCLAGPDEKDLTTEAVTVPRNSKPFSWRGRRVGVLKLDKTAKISPAVRRLYDASAVLLKKAGAKIIPIRLPASAHAVAAYYVITPSEISSNLARFDGLRYGRSSRLSKDLLDYYVSAREEGFGPEVKRRILLGTFALSAGYFDAYYRQAQAVREAIIAEYAAAFKNCEIIMTPATPSAAFKIGGKKDPLAMYLEDVFSVPASLAGVPAVSVPMALKPLPLGLQFIAPRFADHQLLAAAEAYRNLAQLPDFTPNL